jgi:hypothetical protein
MLQDYTTIGHVTVDVLPDGSRRAGGSAFYAALQAARLGLRARVLTRGVEGEIEALLAPFRGELELEVLAAPSTTTLLTSGAGSAREQRVAAWAGVLPAGLELDTHILHLAPVARETPTAWKGRAGFVGLTPQGLARSWGEGPSPLIHLSAPEDQQLELAARCDALVLSEAERAACAGLLAAARAAGATVAITAGAATKTLLGPDGEELRLDPLPVRALRDDLGAGDVFAAAFFVGLHEGRPALEAARFASAAAALRLEGEGPGAIADRAAIERRLSLGGLPERGGGEREGG